MYPAGALTPIFDEGAGAPGGSVDVETDGCDGAEPELNCPREMPGSNKIASTIGIHRQCPLTRS